MSNKTHDGALPVNIYTDGACSGNQYASNTGGWGGVLEYGKHKKEIHGGEINTTNNRMEMMALIAALSELKRSGQFIRVFSDSSYLMNCFRAKWYEKWQKNGWLNSKKEPVENRDLWEKLLPFLQEHDFRFYLVKGHLPLKGEGTALNTAYAKFKAHNGDGFSYEEFLYVVQMNNRADELANIGITEQKI
ncbi:MAG: ribonuclease HI [Clostridiales Family XIII bacterium]|jgi:ribonuclease HI|nr:ribonuclease HI [Clostridiales Family XIII bacterium]